MKEIEGERNEQDWRGRWERRKAQIGESIQGENRLMKGGRRGMNSKISKKWKVEEEEVETRNEENKGREE